MVSLDHHELITKFWLHEQNDEFIASMSGENIVVKKAIAYLLHFDTKAQLHLCFLLNTLAPKQMAAI